MWDVSAGGGGAAASGLGGLPAPSEGLENVKLPQTEAIMEAIIRSSKPLPIGGASGDTSSPFDSLHRHLQRTSDRLVPLLRTRWLGGSLLLASLVARVALIERHFFTAYLLAIYLLNQVLLFLSPATEDDDMPATAAASEEYRPFVRALSEFRLWTRGTVATLIAFTATLFDDLDVDVDGHMLVLYFVLLFAYTMKQQLMHMAKHGYVPWSGSKKAGPRRGEKTKKEMYDV